MTNSNSQSETTGFVPSPPELAIKVTGLSKTFGRLCVLDNIDLEVARGQLLVVVGSNGSGKTTLIKILATLTRPDQAKITVAGFDPTKEGENVRRNIGVLTHDPLLYDGLTGRENLKFFAKMFSLDDIDYRITNSAEKMGVLPWLDQRVGTMSHGMKKRVSISRTLLHDPLILLLDEPESGLDQEALSMFHDLISDSTRTILMTTHDLKSVVGTRQEVAMLSGGKLQHADSAWLL